LAGYDERERVLSEVGVDGQRDENPAPEQDEKAAPDALRRVVSRLAIR
jgi:hypothetical protein